MKILFSFTILLLTSGIAFAQKYYNSYVQIDAGVTINLSDVKRYRFAPTTRMINEIKVGSGIEATFFFSEKVGLNSDVHYFTLAGIIPENNICFNSNVWASSVNLSLAFNSFFTENLRPPWSRRFKLFAKLGYGHLFFKSELQFLKGGKPQDFDIISYSLGESSGKSSFFPVEVSLMYKLNKFEMYKLKKINKHNFTRSKDHLYFVLSGFVAVSNTDKLDNVTGRGFSKDAFTYFSVGISYFFGQRALRVPYI